ncbi:DNA-binding protein [Mannheimia haemolytica]|uniref:helix-turn-helix domain-containing transcriptional regulator n=1 Tax=Mannheimia haemolytica TaxID=75985 RepID=UPI001EF8951A|nr:hypothetical protein [Mannheimia haemolytica]
METIQINEQAAEKHGLRPFDVAEFLTDEATIQAYLAEVLKEGDQDEFLEALNYHLLPVKTSLLNSR